MPSTLVNRRTLLAGAAVAAGTLRLPSTVDAQPEAAGTPGNLSPAGGGSLMSLLERVASPPNQGEESFATLFTYADIERQLETRGLRGLDAALADPDRLREWGDGVSGLWVDDLIVQFALIAELWAAVGFSPAEVTQTMSLGEPPSMVRVYRGAFDGEAIAEALTASGYDRRETEHGPVWSIGPEGEIDLEHPIQRIVISSYNNVAVVDDELIVASGYLSGVETTLAAVAGDLPSLGTNSDILDLVVAAGEDLVSAGLLDGRALSAAGLPDGGLTGETAPVAADDTIPPISLALFGITAGSMSARYTDPDNPLEGDNDDTTARSELVITAQMASEDAAASAVPIIERRLAEGLSLATGQPYADYFERWEVTAPDDGSIVRLRISGDRVGRQWMEFIFRRDLGFLTTE